MSKLSPDQIEKLANGDILKFDAEQARQNIKDTELNELVEVLSKIQNVSKKERVLYLYHDISWNTRKELESRGFKITSHDSNRVETTELYHTIQW